MDHPTYREAMFKGVVQVLESVGRDDKNYDETQKPGDILEMLELILASSIVATSVDRDAVRESCEESYFNIKKIALALHAEQARESKAPENFPEQSKQYQSNDTAKKHNSTDLAKRSQARY